MKLLRNLPLLGTLAILLASVLLQGPLWQMLGDRVCAYADWAGLCEAAGGALPGGLLRWLASVTATLWTLPWLGTGITCLLATAGTYAGIRFAKLPWPVAIAGPALALWQVTYCGFSVWIFLQPEAPTLRLIVWIGFMLLLALARKHPLAALLATAGLYPAVGTPALLALPLLALAPRTAAGRLPWIWFIAAVAAAALLPILWKLLCPFDPAWDVLLLSNASFLAEEHALIWNIAGALPLLVIAAALTVLPALKQHLAPLLEKRSHIRTAAACIGAPILTAGLLLLTMDSIRPLYDILACERAVKNNQTETIRALPTERILRHRMLCAYRIYADWRAGILENTLFDIPYTVSHTASTINAMELDGPELLMRYGLLQIARRWTYESLISKGFNAVACERLAIIALCCGENDLARKYLFQLARFPLRSRRATELTNILDGKAQPDSELQRLAHLHNALCQDSGSPIFAGSEKPEGTIYDRYAVVKNGNKEMIAMYLCASLLRKDTLPFVDNYQVILDVWSERPLPRAFQQALLSTAVDPKYEGKRLNLTPDLFSPGMIEAFNAFQQESPTANPANPKFRKRFGRSYWYYSTFVQ